MWNKSQDLFQKFAGKASRIVGSALAFVISIFMIFVWLAFGPMYHWNTDFQLVANTVTTVITYILVFIIQNSQDANAHALHLKLDELIRANSRAHNTLIGIEHLTENEIHQLQLQIQEQISKQELARQPRKKKQ